MRTAAVDGCSSQQELMIYWDKKYSLSLEDRVSCKCCNEKHIWSTSDTLLPCNYAVAIAIISWLKNSPNWEVSACLDLNQIRTKHSCIKYLVMFLVWLAFIEVCSWYVIAGDLLLADGIEFLFLGGYATDAFEDVGHSTDAKELMQKYLIGKMAEVKCFL